MCIHGGRNDYLMSDTNNFILNDIHLYDICKTYPNNNVIRDEYMDCSGDVWMYV